MENNIGIQDAIDALILGLNEILNIHIILKILDKE